MKDRAESIIIGCIRHIIHRYPVLANAANILKYAETENEIILETDGVHLFYNSNVLINMLIEGAESTIRHRLLHILLHGVLGHFYLRRNYGDKKLIDNAMDIEVEKLINILEGRDNWLLHRHRLTSRGMYREAKRNPNYEVEIESSAIECKGDEHLMWETMLLLVEAKEIMERWRQCCIPCGEGKAAYELMVSYITGDNLNADSMMQDGDKEGLGNNEDARHKTISIRERSNRDYTEKMRRLCHVRENLVSLEDNIDKVLYTYGLELYGDIPLIERDEDAVTMGVDTIIVAIDTSRSCEGKIMERFISETYKIFEDISMDISFGRIIFIQCDDDIRYEEEIMDIGRLRGYENMETTGYGGTDFRPVFVRAAQLEREKGYRIDGLIYLTDSYGIFPEQAPDFPVLLVLPKRPSENDFYMHGRKSELPDWAECIILE